ncbi:RNA (uracil-5-)methyltransferase, putative [Plasmodium relictum]|uniref:RNA (Uracil-5-)methyltransferase, putative n=1 Tax=Plasmodium relictum TaxID=85471 RepID=A0A1J1H6A6_PLARL|nr:RNA (uracil-5-)methyltransferase, putative [Plasmodium relictum]CRH00210.1 RNA (uracil-5-)methyltransferase, putative [Plasmodium relictum]
MNKLLFFYIFSFVFFHKKIFCSYRIRKIKSKSFCTLKELIFLKIMNSNDKKVIIEMASKSTTKNNNVYLSLNNYAKKLKEEYSSTKLIKNNVLSIFSYSLKYMDKKGLNKWLRNNIKAPFYDTFIPKNKPFAYIRFKSFEDLKIFEKMIENKHFHKNDSMSIIKINKSSKYSQKRKFNENIDYMNETKKLKIENLHENDKREDEKELLDLQSIIKINKAQKSKSVENYVTPFYKYSYEDQINIKHKFLKKCKDQILNNLKSKFMKQNLLFGEIETGLLDEEMNMSYNKNIIDNNDNLEKKNKKNETSSDSCFNKTILSNIKSNNNKNREITIDEKMKYYEFEIDKPLYPNEKGTNGYRNKCEFTIAHDENNNIEIGFVVGKMKTDLNENNIDKNANEDNSCNFSENNISNNASPINESQSTRLRNKKQKQSYYLNPVVNGVDDCIHIHPCMKKVVHEMKNIIKDSNYPVFDRVYKTGIWRLLIVRLNSKKELMITVQTYTLDQKKKKEIKKLLINRLTKKKDEQFMSFCDFKVVSLYLQEHDNSNDSTDQSLNEHLWGEEYLEEIILNNRFLLTPSCFFQVNHSSCELLYKKVIDYININKKKKNYIFDLCCGTGTISICASNEIKEEVNIIGIDICEGSIICANKNAEINKIKNYKFIQGRVEELFANEIKNVKEDDSNIIVIVDPPRSGLANSVINILSAHHFINQIIYVSCNPITLINNVTNILFQNENLKIKNLAFVDMFPHTFHVECITNIIKM